MARYRFLTDAYVAGHYFQAGQIADLPSWQPSGAVEPLDDEAAQAFFDAGPQLPPLIRQQWSDRIITQYPATCWRHLGGNAWALTGLGASLGTKKADRAMELP